MGLLERPRIVARPGWNRWLVPPARYHEPEAVTVIESPEIESVVD